MKRSVTKRKASSSFSSADVQVENDFNDAWSDAEADVADDYPARGKHARQFVYDDSLQQSQPASDDAQNMFPRPEESTLEGVSAMGDSIVDALTSEFSISEIPAPSNVGPEPSGAPAPANDSSQAAVASAVNADAAIAVPAAVAVSSVAAGQAAASSDGAEDASAKGQSASNSESTSAEAEHAEASEGSAQDVPEGDLDAEPQEIADDAEFDTELDDQLEFEPPQRKRRISGKKIARAIVILLVVALIACAALFAWDRWFRYDDVHDVLGEWQMSNAERTMVITENNLRITSDVSYAYSLDTKAKTITYTFGDKEGVASYRFSEDRNTLIIDEHVGTDWLVALRLKADEAMESSDVPEGVSRLVRISDDTSALPHSLGESEEGDEEELAVDDIFYVEGYTEYTNTNTSKKKKESSESSSSDSEDDEKDSEDSEDENADPEAAYTDVETGMSYYYDDSQMLYYDMYGNYYYDMYGQNPYEQVVEETYYDEYGYYDENGYYVYY